MFEKLSTPIAKLHLSVVFGWGVILFNLLNWLVKYGPHTDKIGEFIVWMIIILSIRYSAFKPLGMAGTVASGFLALSLWDYFTGQRNAEYASPFFLGILFFLLILFLVRGAKCHPMFVLPIKRDLLSRSIL
ncbi:hypothetical protein [Ammoniphilus resinae]|uniref:Uncharacterized protein YhhL (DUF1145 family) n=1 Tax=Ammoniphilus resinae TaxID=861532 RepID=A0ABS4GP96_9BACL|nr:hypothetical protein [Ammoniphilus resinae]MBP1931882.1 uncharacterized protein YhhL (DUF1145 family) [Ammoniphilus resinae]